MGSLDEQLKHHERLDAARQNFVLGNVKARLRMVAQYAIANARGGLVIGTDHAAEAVMGFFTQFGDGACDLAPIAGLVKGQVRALGAHLAAPGHLVLKLPTADLEELRPGRPDEDAHGVSYADINAFLHGREVRRPASASSGHTRRPDTSAICPWYPAPEHARPLRELSSYLESGRVSPCWTGSRQHIDSPTPSARCASREPPKPSTMLRLIDRPNPSPSGLLV